MGRRSRWVAAAALTVAAAWWLPSLLLRLDDRLWTLALYRRDSGYFVGCPIDFIKDAWGRSFVLNVANLQNINTSLAPRTGAGLPVIYSVGPNGVDDGGARDDIDAYPDPVDRLALDVVDTLPWLAIVVAALVLRRGLGRRPAPDEPWPRRGGVAFGLVVALVSYAPCRDVAALVPSWGPTLFLDPIWSALLVVFATALTLYAKLWRLAAVRSSDADEPASAADHGA